MQPPGASPAAEPRVVGGRAPKSKAMLLRSLAVLLALWSSRLAAQRPPRTPFVARGACPFECCQLGSWLTHDTLPVFDRERASGPPLFVLQPSQGFRADSADFYTLGLGLILVRRPLRLADYLAEAQGPSESVTALRRPLAPGDTVYLVGEVSEVGEQVWSHGRTATVEGFWSEPGAEDPNAPAILVRPIVHEWWVHINAQGRRGSIQAWERHLEGTDACS
jgi:hypothetical protein